MKHKSSMYLKHLLEIYKMEESYELAEIYTYGNIKMKKRSLLIQS